MELFDIYRIIVFSLGVIFNIYVYIYIYNTYTYVFLFSKRLSKFHLCILRFLIT